jgi:hypothetical protein
VADLESKILARELGRLGGFGARWAARRLPSVPFETHFELDDSLTIAANTVEELVNKIGKRIPELEFDASRGLFNVVVGSGHLNINPTILRIQLRALGSRTSVSVSAVAKEGAIKQHSARSAVERIKDILLRETP